MPVYQLIPEISLFPPIEEAEDDGLLAVGGDLTKERLLGAYRRGIFPWYEVGQPILWWSPDPRLVLFPDELKISRSLRKVLRKEQFEIRFDTAFQEVIKSCADVRTKQGEGTWIIPEMQQAYTELHQEGFAHSVESWLDGKLVGGLYGISIGQCFFGESMFHLQDNASKVAFYYLNKYLLENNFDLIDCQFVNDHLLRLGVKIISSDEFINILNSSVIKDVPPKIWRIKE